MSLSKLQVNTKVKTLGEAQTFLREIIRSIDHAIRSGKGWNIGEGEVEEEAPAAVKIEGLDDLARKLRIYVLNSDMAQNQGIDPQEILPALSDILSDAGYGVVEGADELKQPEISKPSYFGGAGSGGGPGGMQDDANAPWNKKK
jgi:hypothetical protein